MRNTMPNGSYLAYNQSKIGFGINIPSKKNIALKRRITKEKHMDKKCVLCGRRTNLELHHLLRSPQDSFASAGRDLKGLVE